MRIRKVLSFDDVLLVPKLNNIPSRDEVDTKFVFAPGLVLDVPIIAANMPTICGKEMAATMSAIGGLGIIHRMQTIESQAKEVKEAYKKEVNKGNTEAAINIGAAIGIGPDCIDRAKACIEAGAYVICIDVAHGYDTRVKKVLNNLLECTYITTIIVGNIATAEAADFLMSGIPESQKQRVLLKCGVGGGSVCTTRIRTGCGIPTLQSVIDVSEAGYAVIADGGIRTSGDIVKCLAAGAKAVMLGNLLAGTDETPGIEINGVKAYMGAASASSKQNFYGKSEYVEGVETKVLCKGPVESVINFLMEGVRSGMTYCGSTDLEMLRHKADFVEITHAGLLESHPHAL